MQKLLSIFVYLILLLRIYIIQSYHNSYIVYYSLNSP